MKYFVLKKIVGMKFRFFDIKDIFVDNWISGFRSQQLYWSLKGCVSRGELHVRLVMWRSWVPAPSKAPVVSLSKKL